MEVIRPDPLRHVVIVSARACEDPSLRDFLLRLQQGDIVTGTVSDIQAFGVFVRLDGEPVDLATGLPGTGFMNVPELSWARFEQVSEIVAVGQRITAKVLGSNARRGQVSLSLKALQEDPFLSWVNHVGEIVSGRVTKVLPIGVFVHLADGVEGLLRTSDSPAEQLGKSPGRVLQIGDEITALITEVDPPRRRVTLSPTDLPVASR